MAWRQLSCRRVNHSGRRRATDEVECCIPPCSNRRRRNWWRTWLAITHPAVLVRASWSKEWNVWVGEDRVLATRTGIIQKRAQCWEELSPCPHATQGGRFLLRSLHVSGTTKDPRTESAIDCQWDVSGMSHLVALWRVLQRYFQVSPKLLKLVLVSWKCHAVAWHHGLYEIWRQACQWFGFAFRLCSWSCMLARENPCRRICMQLAPRTSWSSVLYLSFLFAMLCSSSFCCIFICTNPKQTLLMSARSSFHCGMSTFLVTPSMCCVFICTNSRHTLKTSLCCAFYWRKPCHDHTFDLPCFHMYKPQSNLNSRQRTKPTVAARKKRS